MVKELQIIEVKLLTEVTVWMWQHLSVSIIANVTELDVLSQLLHVIESLLTDKNCTALKTNFAESFVMV